MKSKYKICLAIGALLAPLGVLAARADITGGQDNTAKTNADIAQANKALDDLKNLDQQIKDRRQRAAAEAALHPTVAAPRTSASLSSWTLEASLLNGKTSSAARVGYMPVPIMLSDQKPAGITKEPAYKGKPQYATIHLGNGPKSAYFVVFDEPADGDWKIYVDTNQNGDLTDDGDGAWSKKNTANNRTVYGVNNYVLRASWGNANTETSSGDYGIGIYRIASIKTPFMYRQAARVGSVTVGGKTHKAILVENDADAIFNKTIPTDAEGKPTVKFTTRAVWLLVDMADKGTFSLGGDGMFDVRAPFKIGDTTYEATIADDGSSLTLKPTTKAVAQLTPPRPKPKDLLAAGVAAPDFKAEAYRGGTVQTADYKGKVLILDFWATWCGPCQRSMPHLEKVYKETKNQNVAVLGVCVWDDKSAYENWVPKNKSKYSFPLAFDPAAKDNANSIASKQFNVSGIPTTYIIDPNGKVADAIVGYAGDNDTRIEAALKKLGVNVAVDNPSNK